MAKKKRWIETFSGLASHYGISLNTLTDWRGRGLVVDKHERHGYDLDKQDKLVVEILSSPRSMTRHKKSRNKNMRALVEEAGGDLEKPDSKATVSEAATIVRRTQLAKMGKEEADRARREHENRIAFGDFVEREAVERFFSKMLSRFRDEVMRIPGDFKAQLPSDIRDGFSERMRVRCEAVLMAIHRMTVEMDELEQAETIRGVGRPRSKV